MHFPYKKLILLAALIVLVTPTATHALSLSYIIFNIVGVLLGTAAGLLSTALDLFVLNMGTQVNNTELGIGAGINTVWLLVRDFINLTFVFGLIYVGIVTILGEGGANAKRLIASIVVSALLVNFSLYVSKFIIDVTNVASVEIYEGMGFQTKGRSIADVVMIRSGLMDIATNDFDPTNVPDWGDGWLGYVVTGSIFILVTTFVLAAAGILLIIRFAILVILMAISPVAFISRGLPIVGGWSSRWWDVFIKQALFAPALLFMLFVTLKITDGVTGKTQAFGNIFDKNNLASGYAAMVYFGLLIIGFIASIIIAKQMGAYGADTALKWGKEARKYGQRLVGRSTFGFAGAVGRGTLGQGGYRLAQSGALRDAAAKGGVGGFTARRLLNLSRKASKATYDPRAIKAVGKTLEMGDAKKGGYEGRLKEIEKKELEFAKSLGEKTDKELETIIERNEGRIKELNEQIADARDRGATNEVERLQKERAGIADQVKKDKKTLDALQKERMRNYADTVASGFLGTKRDIIPLRTKLENAKAAEAIRKEMKKKKEKKDEEKILDAIKKVGGDKKGGEDKKDDH